MQDAWSMQCTRPRGSHVCKVLFSPYMPAVRCSASLGRSDPMPTHPQQQSISHTPHKHRLIFPCFELTPSSIQLAQGWPLREQLRAYVFGNWDEKVYTINQWLEMPVACRSGHEQANAHVPSHLSKRTSVSCNAHVQSIKYLCDIVITKPLNSALKSITDWKETPLE
jgi:hypothetical protein